jgi:hypothetical protein
MAVRLLAILLLFTACQRESEMPATPAAAPAAAPRDVCATLTVDELNKGAGLKDATGQSSKSGDADVCTWTDDTGKSVIVQVFSSASSYDQSRTAFESLYGGTAEDIAAIGEKAFFISGTTSGMPTGTLVVAKGSTPVSVQVMGGSGDATTRKGEATAIAHVVLTKV